MSARALTLSLLAFAAAVAALPLVLGVPQALSVLAYGLLAAASGLALGWSFFKPRPPPAPPPQAPARPEPEAATRGLQHQTELYQSLLKAQSDLGDGVVITEAARIVFANEALSTLYGYSVEELLRFPSFLDLIVPEDRAAVAERLRQKMATREDPSMIGETSVERKDGSRITIEYAMKVLREGETFKVFAIVRDVTERNRQHQLMVRSLAQVAEARDLERKRSEDLRLANQQLLVQQQKLVQAEKLACVGKLAAGVAHEINNPVTGLMGCVRLLQSEPGSEARRQEYLEVIGDGLRQIARTVSALLRYAREQPAGISATDLSEVVAGCVPLIRLVLKSQQVELDSEIAPGSMMVLANSSLLGQAVMNVLLNAVHASPPHSRVTVSARREGERVALQFVDRGVGIAPQHLEHVCDPFFTTRPEGEGVGLGLSVAQGILASLGGDLEIASEVGQGTLVTFWLAVAPPGPGALTGLPFSTGAGVTAQ